MKVDRLRYDPEILKVILEEKAVSAGVDIFYDSELTEAEEREDCCRITVRNLYATWNMESSYLADASGNANLSRRLGGDNIKTPEEKQLTSTLMFRISGVDIQKLNEFLNSGQLPSCLLGKPKKAAPWKELPFELSPASGHVGPKLIIAVIIFLFSLVECV